MPEPMTAMRATRVSEIVYAASAGADAQNSRNAQYFAGTSDSPREA
jgi:hypothetical protein